MLPEDADLDPYLRVIDISAISGNYRLNILMDGHHDIAIGYLEQRDWQDTETGQSSLSTF
jgi:hypothetical protein